MKITTEHYNDLASKLAQVITGELVSPRMAHQPIPLLYEYLDAGMSAMRWRWDLLYYGGLSNWIGETLYSYLNDDHIDTAMRKITGTK